VERHDDPLPADVWEEEEAPDEVEEAMPEPDEEAPVRSRLRVEVQEGYPAGGREAAVGLTRS